MKLQFICYRIENTDIFWREEEKVIFPVTAVASI